MLFVCVGLDYMAKKKWPKRQIICFTGEQTVDRLNRHTTEKPTEMENPQLQELGKAHVHVWTQ